MTFLDTTDDFIKHHIAQETGSSIQPSVEPIEKTHNRMKSAYENTKSKDVLLEEVNLEK